MKASRVQGFRLKRCRVQGSRVAELRGSRSELRLQGSRGLT